MPSYKNAERNTWYCAFYFTDWQGKRKKKKKEGFKTKREAQEWERKFLEQYAGTPDISFDVLVKTYLARQKGLISEASYYNTVFLTNKYILPYFNNTPINKINKQSITGWKNHVMSDDMKPSYKKSIYIRLKQIFNFAIDYYNLPYNPCPNNLSLGQIVPLQNYWTIDEFRQFATTLNKPHHIMAFYLLFWTGIRCGELLALTWNDVDFSDNSLSISKSYKRLHKKDILTSGKTAASRRIVIMPQFIADMLKDFQRMNLYSGNRIFDFSSATLNNKLIRGAEIAGVKRIRIHDLRHSHASMLINAGFQPIDVADRLGHSNANITLKVYSHFYDTKRYELANKLNDIH